MEGKGYVCLSWWVQNMGEVCATLPDNDAAKSTLLQGDSLKGEEK